MNGCFTLSGGCIKAGGFDNGMLVKIQVILYSGSSKVGLSHVLMDFMPSLYVLFPTSFRTFNKKQKNKKIRD